MADLWCLSSEILQCSGEVVNLESERSSWEGWDTSRTIAWKSVVIAAEISEAVLSFMLMSASVWTSATRALKVGDLASCTRYGGGESPGADNVPAILLQYDEVTKAVHLYAKNKGNR